MYFVSVLWFGMVSGVSRCLFFGSYFELVII